MEIKLSDIKPYGKNAKKHPDKQLKQIADSLKEFGWRQPIVVDKDNVIIVGHGRWMAYQKYPDGVKEPWVIKADDLTPEQVKAYRLADNKLNESEWDLGLVIEELRELPANLFDLTGFDKIFEFESDIKSEGIDKKLENIKILNLYSCIGGNRKLWGDLDITAVEINSEIAKIYQDYFPKDKLIIGDAHKYLEKYFSKYDFIWSSPPCPTHSNLRKGLSIANGAKPVYPDMKLYEEILFLQGYFKGKWVVENVVSWYDPLIEPQKRGRHYYWSNFEIPEISFPKSREVGNPDDVNYGESHSKYGFNLDKYKISSKYPKAKILRDIVYPKAGEYILKCAFKEKLL